MDNPTKKPSNVKPEKPYPDFPLFPHATGRWAKKVKGRMYYFGPWGDPAAAEAKWKEQQDDLRAGRKPSAITDETTVKEVVNRFLTSKEAAMASGNITARTFRDYNGTCGRVVDCFGRNTPAANLTPEDFQRLAGTFSTWAPVSRANEVQRVRTLFRYAFESELLDKPARFGPDFKKPSAKTIRIAKAEKPTRLFSREEIGALLKKASVQLKAMILLGINCGLGNSDASELNRAHLDLKSGILDYPRPKTGIDRRAVLWAETVKAIKEVLKRGDEVLTVGDGAGKPRYHPANAADADAVFITHQQRRFVRHDDKSTRDSVALAFGKLLRSADLKREGINFYSLRHTFRTIAAGAKDSDAVDRVMGHLKPDVSTGYTHWTKDEEETARLRAIAEHVRAWLYPPAKVKREK